jgi:NAD-dependent dihydropyrimidine dehydrogenase PreA subunit
MGIFINVKIDYETCLGPENGGQCVGVCPVSIFEPSEAKVVVQDENEDECILCNLCLDKCQASAISITKLYE